MNLSPIDIHFAPEGYVARRHESGSVFKPQELCTTRPDLCRVIYEDVADKPRNHLVLRQSDAVPVPPTWAKWYRVWFRSKDGSDVASAEGLRIDGWYWPIDGDDCDILAIEWLSDEGKERVSK